MRTVIFDLDGTLADTTRDLIAAANVCFRRLGFGDMLDPEKDQRTAVKGSKAMLRLGFDRLSVTYGEDDIERNHPVLVEAYTLDIDKHTTLYPGVAAAMEGLVGAGYALGVCTNKPEGLADELLSRLGVRRFFGSLVGADTLSVRKPDPAPLRAAVERLGGDPARSVLVGDSTTDRETARAAGVGSILVTFGPDGMDVENMRPDGLLHDYGDLKQLVGRLIG